MSNVRWKKNRLLLAFIETGVQMCADFAVLSVFSLEDQILSYLRAKKNDKSTLGFYFRAATTWSAVLASSRVTFCHCNKDSWGGKSADDTQESPQNQLRTNVLTLFTSNCNTELQWHFHSHYCRNVSFFNARSHNNINLNDYVFFYCFGIII